MAEQAKSDKKANISTGYGGKEAAHKKMGQEEGTKYGQIGANPKVSNSAKRS